MTDYILKINQLIPQLNPLERRIAECFLNSQDSLFRLPIKEIAESCECSQAAIVRFCQMLGYTGFKDFKRQVTASFISRYNDEQKKVPNYSDIRVSGDLGSIIEKITDNAITSIRDTAKVLDERELFRAVQAVNGANRIMFFGMATSGSVAEDACQRFARLGKNCQHFDDLHMQFSAAATLKKGDAAVLISSSGRTGVILDLMKLFKESGVTTIAVTNYGQTPLSRGCDIVLSMLSTDIPVRTASLSTRLSQLVVIDMLFTAVASLNYDTVEPMLEKSYRLCVNNGKP